MKKHNIKQKIHCSLNSLHLADKCLLLFMIILMLQSAYNLFFHGTSMADNGNLDVIVRTTAAAIFGYFISANFQNGGKNTPEGEKNQENGNYEEENNNSNSPSGEPVAQIGFSAKSESQKLNTCRIHGSGTNKSECRNRLQIIVVASIGIFALFMLLFARNYMATTGTAAATISQLRDFISGSVGFLIGHSTHQKK